MKLPLIVGSPPTLRSQVPLNTTVVGAHSPFFGIVHLLTRAFVQCAISMVLPSTENEWSQVPFEPSIEPSNASRRTRPSGSLRWRHAVPKTPHLGAANAAVAIRRLAQASTAVGRSMAAQYSARTNSLLASSP